jgi:hypothetical protein
MGGTPRMDSSYGLYHSGGIDGVTLERISTSSGSGTTIFSRVWAVISSMSRMTGVRYFSAKLKAMTVISRHSRTSLADRTMIGWSPWVPQRACCTSPWEGLVGSPVLGPPRMTLTITEGISVMQA